MVNNRDETSVGENTGKACLGAIGKITKLDYVLSKRDGEIAEKGWMNESIWICIWSIRKGSIIPLIISKYAHLFPPLNTINFMSNNNHNHDDADCIKFIDL